MIIDIILYALFLGFMVYCIVINSPSLKKQHTLKEKILSLSASVAFLAGFILSLTLLVGKPTVNSCILRKTANNRYLIRSITIEVDPSIAIIREKTNYPYTLLRDRTVYKSLYLENHNKG